VLFRSEAFSSELAARPRMVAVNKLDLEATRRLKARSRRKEVQFISALTGEGLPELMRSIVSTLAAAPEPRLAAKPKATRLPVAPSFGVVVQRHPWGFAVRGERVELLVERTDLESEGALARFQSVLDRLGVNTALESAGVEPGDTVRIAGVEFEYQP
jgi:GTP-binding protein